MKTRKIIFFAGFALFGLLASGLFLIAQTDEAEDDERPKRDLRLRPLAHGLQWSSGLNPADIKPPRVEKIGVPTIRTEGVKTFGIAYDIKMDVDTTEYPLHLSIPLPKEALADPGNILFLKVSGDGDETLLFPSAVDEENARATLILRSFSKIIPCSWEITYHRAVIEGTMTMKEDAEELPESIYFDMSCPQTHSGVKANFVQVVDGLGPFKFFMPLPSTHFGTYVFQRIIGYSSTFIFSGDPIVSSPLHIDGSSPVYHVTLNVIPVTTKMEGLVVDLDGNPQEDVRIHLSGPYKVTYKTRSRDGGRYLIEIVGMTDPRVSMTEDMPCTLIDPEDMTCEPAKLTVTLTAGRTFRENLVYDPKGEIRGYIRDKFKNSLERATIEVTTSRGETIIREVGSPFHIEDLPVGETTVTVTCEKGVHQETKTIDVSCKAPGAVGDFHHFELGCSGEIRGHIRDKDGNNLVRATIEVTTPQGETFAWEVDGPYHIEDLPVGEITVTAVCPGGGGSQSRTVRLACDMADSEKADTDFVLDCDPGTLFHINHSGIFSSEGAMYNIQASAGAEFTLALPDGQTEAEVDVVYTVEQHLKNNPGGAVRILSITPQSYVLTAVLRWRVEKSTNRDGVDEYTFGAEIIDRETAKIVVVTRDRDGEPVEWNMEGVGNAVDLCFPQTWFQVRKGKDIDEFPFSEKSASSDSMPHALIGISQTRPDAPKFDDSDNQVESKIRIDMQVRSKD